MVGVDAALQKWMLVFASRRHFKGTIERPEPFEQTPSQNISSGTAPISHNEILVGRNNVALLENMGDFGHLGRVRLGAGILILYFTGKIPGCRSR